MSSLYEELKNKAESAGKRIDPKKIATELAGIYLLDKESVLLHIETIAFLLIHHEITTEGMMLGAIPAKCKNLPENKGCIVMIASLPPLLQAILQEYIDKFSE